MKKLIGSVVLAAALAATFSGCSGKDAQPEEANFECTQEGVRAPEWTCMPDSAVEGSLTDLGSAPFSKLGAGFTRTEAMANARNSLSFQVETKVKAKVEQFARSTGAGSDEVADKVSTQVSKQTSKIALTGSKQLKSWQHPTTKTLYVLVGVDEKSINQEAKNNVKSSYKNDNALWQQFQAKNALESLEKEFPTE